jgi:hypothetical protein
VKSHFGFLLKLLLLLALFSCQNEGGVEFTPNKLITVEEDENATGVASVTAVSISSGNYKLGSTIYASITFNKRVSVSGAIPNVVLDVGGNQVNATFHDGNATKILRFKYVVQMGDLDLNGVQLLSPINLNGASIKDLANTPASSLSFTDTVFSNALVDTTIPTITDIYLPPSSSYKYGNILSFQVEFSETVYVYGLPSLRLNIDGLTKYATYVGGAGTNTLTFNYSVEDQLNDANGIGIVSPIFNSQFISDSFTNAISPNFLPPDSSGIIIDSLAPQNPTLQIESGASYTTSTSVALNLSATDATQMYVTNTSGCSSGGAWESYSTSKSWTLGQSNAVATVYVKYRDLAGNESACVSDTIVHDNTAPSSTTIAINSSEYTATTSVALTLAATGASEMYISNTASCSSGGSWESYSTSKAWTLAQTNALATVYVKYRDLAGNESSCISDTITHDDTVPTSTTIAINSSEFTTSTSVTLNLTANGASQMYVTNTSGCGSGGAWESYATTKAWTLGQTNALATVYVKFRNMVGNESSCISDTITHDTIAPTTTSIAINSSEYTNSTSVTLTLAATGASEMYVSNTSGCGAGGSWESYATSKAWTLGQSNAVATVYVKYRDQAGNESSCINDTITHDSTAPTSTSIAINSSEYTNSSSATLNLFANEASEMYITNTAACSGDGSWESYSTTKTWTLGKLNGLATVYVKYRDLAGNESSCINDTITHDNWAPSGSIAINSSEYSTSTSVTLNLSSGGASEMYVTNTATCSSGGTWESYATTKAWTLGQTNALATVYVKYRDLAGNESSCINDSITHDTIAPTSTSIAINSSELTNSTSVTLNLAATGASEMYVTNTAACSSGGAWESYATTKAWTLGQSNAVATVYVKYRDLAGNESSCINDTITHDSTAPTSTSIAINSSELTNSTSVTLTLAATGASEMYVTNTATCSGGGSWESYATSKAWTLGQSNAVATVYVKYRDLAGNESSCINDTITHDDTAPTSTTIAINSSEYTTSTSVTLNLSATGASEMYVTNTAACSSGGAWESYATTKAWTLGQSNAVATVYVKYRDLAGNESSCINDSITHDTIAPTSTSIAINSSEYTSSTSVTLNLAATGASEMYVTNTATCSSGGTWESYTTTKAWTLGQSDAVATVYVKYRDQAGNQSACISDTITHDSTVPSSTTIAINSSEYTTSTSVTLNLTATGAAEMYVTNTAACSSGGSWESYSTTKAWTLGQTNALATVYVKFRNVVGNESSCISDTITHDTIAPTSTSLAINSSELTNSTSVTLTLAATGASQMYVTNTAACSSGGAWESYATSKAWTLGQSNAVATVYVKYRDQAGNESSCINDTITHDSSAPTSTSIAINSSELTNSTSVTLTLAATGAAEMYVTNTAACSSGGAWESYATSKAWTLGQTNALATVYVKYRDQAGNESSCINDTITHDNTAPTSTSISIAAGATFTTTTSITLTLAATGASEMYVTNTATCSSGGAWESYATSKAWTLGQTNSVATVYVKYRDLAGNESSCINDTITHDNTAPTSTSISIAAGASLINTTAVTLTLASTGASEMYVTNTAGCGSGGAWESYATSKAWTLGQTNAVATVYVKYRDQAGNESSCINDTITHDKIVPSISSITMPANGTYSSGNSLSFTVNFSENVTVAGGTPRLALTFTSGTVYANLTGGSGTSALTFAYTVLVSDSSSPSITVASLDLNGATIRDSAGNDTLVTLSSPANTIVVSNGGATLVWQNGSGSTITSHDFGNQNSNTNATLYIKNTGTITSGTVTVSIPTNPNTKLSLGTNNCTSTLAANSSCSVQINFQCKNPANGQVYNGKVNATATPGTSVNLSVTGSHSPCN